MSDSERQQKTSEQGYRNHGCNSLPQAKVKETKPQRLVMAKRTGLLLPNFSVQVGSEENNEVLQVLLQVRSADP
jgi:hypothetical protein